MKTSPLPSAMIRISPAAYAHQTDDSATSWELTLRKERRKRKESLHRLGPDCRTRRPMDR
jgi:hypothetical protein